MKTSLAAGLLSIILGIGNFHTVTSIGSTTYESDNGFPVMFLNDLMSSPVVKRKLVSRWKWEVWDVVPGTHAYQIYVFNITNPGEVEKGEKPKLKELGPYYYKEFRYKFGVSMNLDTTVNFQRNFTYTFDPKRSTGKEEDTVNVINIPFIVFSTLAVNHDPANANRAISELVASGESLIKKNVKIADLLFHGMDVAKYEKYLSMMGPSTWLTDEFREGLHSILKLKNGVHEGAFTVYSGFKEESRVGKIKTYNDKETLSYWKGETCNEIKGSDGSVFPPHLKHSDKLSMLEVDLCRSIDFEYSQDIQFKQVVGNLYTIGKDVLEDPAVNKENACFCGNSTCLKKGVLDVSSCQFGAPYVMSYAHFLDASPEYQQGVVGLNPDHKVHTTQVSVEPVTGAVINFHKRYQWNIWIKPLEGVDYFKNFKSMLVPVFWNDDIFLLDPDKEELLMEELASLGGGMGGSGSNPTCVVSVTLAGVIFFAVFIFAN